LTSASENSNSARSGTCGRSSSWRPRPETARHRQLGLGGHGDAALHALRLPPTSARPPPLVPTTVYPAVAAAVAKWVEKLPDEVRRARLGQGRGAFRTKSRAGGASWSRIPPLLLIASELNQPGAKQVTSVDSQHCIRGIHRRAGCRAAGLHPGCSQYFSVGGGHVFTPDYFWVGPTNVI
jgi:hypothetical protein